MAAFRKHNGHVVVVLNVNDDTERTAQIRFIDGTVIEVPIRELEDF